MIISLLLFISQQRTWTKIYKSIIHTALPGPSVFTKVHAAQWRYCSWHKLQGGKTKNGQKAKNVACEYTCSTIPPYPGNTSRSAPSHLTGITVSVHVLQLPESNASQQYYFLKQHPPLCMMFSYCSAFCITLKAMKNSWSNIYILIISKGKFGYDKDLLNVLYVYFFS